VGKRKEDKRIKLKIKNNFFITPPEEVYLYINSP
jgi:hypothetical protein